jgi:subfamily B ATP-binding cassette protein MsbA
MLAFRPMKSLATTHATLSEGLIATSRVFALIDYTSKVEEIAGAKPLRVTGRGDQLPRRELQAMIAAAPFCRTSPWRSRRPEGGAGRQSGAGKSTVINLVLRFFESHVPGRSRSTGRIFREATLASVRGAAALLTQDPPCCSTTRSRPTFATARSRDRGGDDPGPRTLRACARFHHAPAGGLTRTRVGEAGYRLSGGERQRIAFAAPCMRDTPILLLDEPPARLTRSRSSGAAAMDRSCEAARS